MSDWKRGVDRAAGDHRGDRREQRRGRDAEALVLALEVAAGAAAEMAGVQARQVLGGRAVLLGDVDDHDADDEEEGHRAEDHPALAAVADHATERERQRRRDQHDEEHLERVGERGRVLQRVGRVDVEEAAAVGPEHLDRLLRGDRAAGDAAGRAAERLQDALETTRTTVATIDSGTRMYRMIRVRSL